jgi:hypothetical protein
MRFKITFPVLFAGSNFLFDGRNIARYRDGRLAVELASGKIPGQFILPI